MARILLMTASFILILGFDIQPISASPCCGQSSSSLSVMTQRQKMNLIVNQSQARALGRVFDSSDFYVWEGTKNRVMDITQLSLSYGISDRLQTYLSTAYQMAKYSDETYKQSDDEFMDTSLGLTYEVLPEYTFSYYKPTVYLTVFANLPTGHSVFEGNSGAENISVSGHGQWGLGFGVTAQKILLPWSMLIQFKSLGLIKKDFAESSADGFFDSSAQITVGYSLGIWDLSLNMGLLQVMLSDRVITYQDRTSESLFVPSSNSTTISLGLIKPINESVVLALTYSDQSILGRPKNSLLSQVVSLSLSYNLY